MQSTSGIQKRMDQNLLSQGSKINLHIVAFFRLSLHILVISVRMFLFTIIIMYRNLHCNKKMNNELERSYKNYQGTPFHIAAFRHILDQSILISNLSGRPDICLGPGTSKKLGPKYRVQKAGCKKQGHCYSKREEAA